MNPLELDNIHTSTTEEDLDRYRNLVKSNPKFAGQFFKKYYNHCEKYGDNQMQMTVRLAATAYKNYLYLPFGFDEETYL